MISINPWELFWTVINFFLLYFILKKLLYKPLVRFMDERKARIDSALAAEKEARELFEGEQAQFEDEKARLIHEAKVKTTAALEARRAKAARDFREQSAQKRQEMKTSVADIGDEERARFEENESALAELLVNKLLCVDSPAGDGA